MAISKEKKQQLVAELTELLTRSKAVILSDYRGLTASQMAELRNKLRPLNSRFMVTKNSMLLRSLEEVGLPKPEELLQGPTAIALCFEDVSEPTRVISDFGKDTEFLQIKGGLLGDRIITANEVQTLAHLPAQEVLLSQTLAGLQSPISGFVGLLDGALRGLLYVFDARAKQLGEASSA